jgi:hypothetical protein
METDKRRYRVVTVRRINAETYWLEIDGVMWSEVEWSPSRRAWCIQDAAGACLAHVESIQGQTPDVQEAIRLAKRILWTAGCRARKRRTSGYRNGNAGPSWANP